MCELEPGRSSGFAVFCPAQIAKILALGACDLENIYLARVLTLFWSEFNTLLFVKRLSFYYG